MATSTIKTSGGDYSTIAAWESATDNDLVTAAEGEVGEVYDSTGGWAENVDIEGATTNGTYYRTLRPATASQHDGTKQSSDARIAPSSGDGVQINENYFRLMFMEVEGGADGIRPDFDRGDLAGVWIYGCLLHAQTSKGINMNVENTGSDISDSVIACNLVVDNAGSGDRNGIQCDFNTGTGSKVFNNTVYGYDVGSFGSAMDILCDTGGGGSCETRNNAVFIDSGNTCYDNTDGTFSDNASSDGSGSTGLINLTDTDEFVDPGANEDYTPKSGGSLIDNGFDTSGDLGDGDLFGNTRKVNGTVDIGAVEVQGGAAPTGEFPFHRYYERSA